MTEFRKMRRFRQELDHEACLEMINRATSGVLSVLGDGGYPYGVPLGYVYVDGAVGPVDEDAPDADNSKSGTDPQEGFSSVSNNGEDRAVFYFHCAKTGHKIDALRSCDKACFTIIDRDDVVSDEFTTYFRSVVCFGRTRILETKEEMMPAIWLLARRYSPDESDESTSQEIDREFAGLAMIEFTVEHMTGKEAIELVRKREKFE